MGRACISSCGPSLNTSRLLGTALRGVQDIDGSFRTMPAAGGPGGKPQGPLPQTIGIVVSAVLDFVRAVNDSRLDLCKVQQLKGVVPATAEASPADATASAAILDAPGVDLVAVNAPLSQAVDVALPVGEVLDEHPQVGIKRPHDAEQLEGEPAAKVATNALNG